jgi:hypothetical protein
VSVPEEEFLAVNLEDEIELSEDDYSLTDEEIIGYIWTYIEDCEGQDDDEVANTRKKSLDYWMGRKYGNEKQGFSKVVSREVFETVEWAMPTFVRTFLSGDRVCEIKPSGPQDMEEAELETDVLHQLILEDEESYETWEMLFRATLIYPNGYIKVWMDETYDWEDREMFNLTQAQVGILDQNPELELTFVEPVAQPSVPMPLFNVGVRRVSTKGRIVIDVIPPEEILVLNSSQKVNLDKSKFVAHHSRPTRSDLVEMGYDRDEVWNLPSSDEVGTNDEIQQRRQPDTGIAETSYAEKASDTVDFYECYVRMDTDGDGIQEFRKICIGGTNNTNQIFENEEIDYMPLVAFTCYGVPFAHRGLSVASTAEENQLVNSTVLRQLLDNLYRTNRPRTFAGRGVNINQLNTYQPHGVVEMQDVSQVRSEVIPPVIQQIMPTFEYLAADREGTTGITRHAQGIDARTLADSSMTAYVNALGQASQRLEAIARYWGEVGFTKVFRKAHYLMRKYQNIQETMEIAGKWVDVNPANWAERSRIRCLVGLGTGNTQEKIAGTLSLLEIQQNQSQQGLSTPSRIYNSLRDLVRVMNRGSVDKYFLDPNSREAQALQAQQRQMSEQQQQMMNQALLAQIEDIRAGNEIDMAKLMKDYEDMMLKHEQKMTELELTYNENVPGSAV